MIRIFVLKILILIGRDYKLNQRANIIIIAGIMIIFVKYVKV